MSLNPFKVVQVVVPAKLNLFLELLGRRDDGFHELETIMIAINRFDRIEVAISNNESIELKCDWEPHFGGILERYENLKASVALPSAQDNLVFKAVAMFRESFGVSNGFNISIRKSIPVGAGMGGASSDAAATLRAVATLCGVDQHDPQLLKIAARLGSDIPLFFGLPKHKTVAAFATGRGEMISAIPCSKLLHFVVVHPPEAVSTAQVFANCSIPAKPVSARSMGMALEGGSLTDVARHMLNRLHDPACTVSRWVERVLNKMRSLPVLGCQLTGSGSACFGLCRTSVIAQRVARQLQASNVGLAFAAKPVSLPSQKWLFT